jgi:ribosomal protein L10
LQNVINNMSIKAEEIRQAKKFLENKKLSVKVIKPRLFAMASKELNKDFDDTLNELTKALNGKTTTSNKDSNKKA